jgi:hypothetical protein
VPNAQRTNITLSGVADAAGNVMPNTTVTMATLLGDTNGNGIVNSSDLAEAKANSGQPVSAANFKSDVTMSGSINGSDVGLVKAQSGTALP